MITSPETRVQIMALRARIRTLITSALLHPDDENRVRLHAKAIAVAEWEICRLEGRQAL